MKNFLLLFTLKELIFIEKTEKNEKKFKRVNKSAGGNFKLAEKTATRTESTTSFTLNQCSLYKNGR